MPQPGLLRQHTHRADLCPCACQARCVRLTRRGGQLPGQLPRRRLQDWLGSGATWSAACAATGASGLPPTSPRKLPGSWTSTRTACAGAALKLCFVFSSPAGHVRHGLCGGLGTSAQYCASLMRAVAFGGFWASHCKPEEAAWKLDKHEDSLRRCRHRRASLWLARGMVMQCV